MLKRLQGGVTNRIMTGEAANVPIQGYPVEKNDSRNATYKLRQKPYRLRNEVLPCHRELLYNDLDEHREMETSSTGLFQWVSTWGPVIRHSVQEAKLLRTYFQQSGIVLRDLR